MTKRLLTIAAIFAVAFSTAVYAAPEKEKSEKKPKAPAVKTYEGMELKAERIGEKVTLNWTLPKDNWRVITISRNDKESAKGRAKVKEVNPSKASKYVDTVPDAAKQYWYWLKVSRTGGEPVEIGPIEAKE